MALGHDVVVNNVTNVCYALERWSCPGESLHTCVRSDRLRQERQGLVQYLVLVLFGNEPEPTMPTERRHEVFAVEYGSTCLLAELDDVRYDREEGAHSALCLG